MLDCDALIKRQQQGIALLDSLQDNEKEVIKYYCSMLATGLVKMAESRKAPVDDIAVNAVKNGLALGLQLIIQNGEVK